MPNPRNHLAGAALDGKIYAVGGQHEGDERSTNQSEVDAYDPTTDRWERVADLPEPRGHIASFVLDNCIVAVGGSVDGGDNGLATAEVTAYDPDMNVWVELPPLPEGRKTPVADAVGDRMIVTTGSGTDTTWVGVLANSRETGNLTAPCSEVAPRRTVGA
jgi:N-acetylneuraminic acid mutarotase